MSDSRRQRRKKQKGAPKTPRGKRAKRTSWAREEISLQRLEALDADPRVRVVSEGSLPGWLRRKWARAKLGGALAWLNEHELPAIYASSGERLPREATLGVVRILSKTTASACVDEVSLVDAYVHPIAMARLTSALAGAWFMHEQQPRPLPLSHVEVAQCRWIAHVHKHFGDRHGTELIFRALYLRGSALDRSFLIAFRELDRFSQLLLDTLGYSNEGGVARVAREVTGREVTYFRSWSRWRYRSSWRSVPRSRAVTPERSFAPMTFEQMVETIRAWGLEYDGHDPNAAGGEERWVGLALFEIFARIADDYEVATSQVRASNEDALFVARVVLEILFEQSIAQLEHALANQTRWERGPWSEIFLSNKYLRFWAGRIVWAAFDPSGRALEHTFRVCEDYTLADQHDEPFELPERALIGVVSADALDQAAIDRWGELMASYEVVAPIEQL